MLVWVSFCLFSGLCYAVVMTLSQQNRGENIWENIAALLPWLFCCCQLLCLCRLVDSVSAAVTRGGWFVSQGAEEERNSHSKSFSEPNSTSYSLTDTNSKDPWPWLLMTKYEGELTDEMESVRSWQRQNCGASEAEREELLQSERGLDVEKEKQIEEGRYKRWKQLKLM